MMRSKATNASMWMRRERSHNQRTNKKPEAYQMIAEKHKFFQIQIQLNKKNELLFKLCKWTKREQRMQLLIFLF